MNCFKQIHSFYNFAWYLVCSQKFDTGKSLLKKLIFFFFLCVCVFRPRLKNVDRSSAQHLEVTVGDLTVIITDFKEKAKSAPASSAAAGDQHSQSSCSSDNTERGVSRSSSPRGEASSLNGESH